MEGTELKRMLGLEKIDKRRLDFIEEDFAEHFPFQWPASSDSSSLTKLILCLRPIEPGFELRIGSLLFRKDPFDFHGDIVQTCLAPFVKQDRNGSELAITALLSLLAHGQIGLNDVFGATPGSLVKCDVLNDVRRRLSKHMLSRFPKPNTN